ncbi:MAG: glutamine--fructose-6-phosphate transaminase (isomerizing) [Candidatus Eisenbacteria bacterium]
MCGIIGYVGSKDVLPLLIEGLKRLEYRGYDSAGVAIHSGGKVLVEKVAGKISALEERLATVDLKGSSGIGHTRWATHGVPSQTNAHPHVDCASRVALVHNGIIENCNVLRSMLTKEGHSFRTDTDTEVLAHLIERFCERGKPLEESVRGALRMVKGTYGLAVISADEPGKIVAARHGSPLVIGVGDNENFVASDVPAILSHTRDVVYLDDGEVAVLTKDGFSTVTSDDQEVIKEVERITWDLEMAEKGGFPHFMLKEIFEQPQSIMNAMAGRTVPETGQAHLGGVTLTDDEIRNISRIVITACGTSWHAGLIGEYMLEEYTRIPVEVEYASEFRYRDPLVDPSSVVVVISQSGETADTLAAMREAQQKGSKAVGICNVVGSTIARESDCGTYVHAGPEIGVASTKAFTSQVIVEMLLTLHLAETRLGRFEAGREIVRALQRLPEQVQGILERSEEIKKIALEYASSNNFLYLGRGSNFPVALEGALKLKEISYIHAEGYPAAEMKHGPIALIDDKMPVVVIAVKDSAYDKIMGNIEEVRARGGRILAIASEGDGEIAKKVDRVIYVPMTLPALTPILSVIPLQLLAYHIAVSRGCNVDQPRNLAKSVTVE